MVVLINGATHTGKTALAQKLTERYKIPYFSIDHLKMGLIRSKQTALTVSDDDLLVPYLWNIVKEMIKTVIENRQNLIIEGCYIPFDWKNYFTEDYLSEIKFYCLIMSEKYIESNYSEIIEFENVIERRLNGGVSKSGLISENNKNLSLCKRFGLDYILIDSAYDMDVTL